MAKLFNSILSYKSYLFYEMNTRHFNNIGNTYNQFIFKEFMESDFQNNRLFEKKDRMARYVYFLKCGHRCFGFVDAAGHVVSYLWLSVEGMTVPFSGSSTLKVGQGIAYIWDCRTAEEYQGTGLYKEGLKRLTQFATSLNVQRVMICHLNHNKIAYNTMCSLQFNYVYTVSVLHCLTMTLVLGPCFLPQCSFKNILCTTLK